jgi:hypothetical protein
MNISVGEKYANEAYHVVVVLIRDVHTTHAEKMEICQFVQLPNQHTNTGKIHQLLPYTTN